MLTPVHSDLTLDLQGAAAMVEWLITRKCVSTVFARSGMGKMYTFTVEEAKALGKTVVNAASGRLRVLLGASGEWRTRAEGVLPDPETYLAQAVALTRYAQEIGADGAVHVLPEAYELGRQEPALEATYRYYRTVHDAASIPIVLYQPGGIRPECRMTTDLLRRLLELPRIVGMKVSTHDDAVFTPLAEVIRGTNFALIAGDETYYHAALKQGAVGVIGEGCSVYPEILEAIRTAFLGGHEAQAARAQVDVIRALAIKEGLDGATFWKQFIIAHGVQIGPWDRSAVAPYPDRRVREVTTQVEVLIGPYRS